MRTRSARTQPCDHAQARARLGNAARHSVVVPAATITVKRLRSCARSSAVTRAAKALLDLLNLKDTARYGLIPITGRELATALRRAGTLLDFASEVVGR